MDLHISGAREFFLLAADCRDAARTDLERELRAGLRRSVQPTQQAIRSAAERTMPAAGGYRAVLTPALRVTPKALSVLGIQLTVAARGQGEDRDVKRLDGGELRHPVFGRSRRGRRRGERIANPWSVTSIPPGFATKTFERQADAIVGRLGEAMQVVADKIAGG